MGGLFLVQTIVFTKIGELLAWTCKPSVLIGGGKSTEVCQVCGEAMERGSSVEQEQGRHRDDGTVPALNLFIVGKILVVF